MYCIIGPSLPSGNPFNSSTTSCAISHTHHEEQRHHQLESDEGHCHQKVQQYLENKERYVVREITNKCIEKHLYSGHFV